MITILSRLLAGLSLFLAALTLIKPRSGWGRLALFIPKLFAGSLILPVGVVGLAAAALGWLAGRDLLALALGAGAGLITLRTIVRIANRAGRAASDLPLDGALPTRAARNAMLAHPWVGYWAAPARAVFARDQSLGQRSDGSVLLADLWQPLEVPPTGLVLVYLHGSGWHYADKDFGTRQFFGHLSAQGHTVLDLAYALAPHADLHSMLDDIWRALHWLQDKGKDSEIRAGRVVLGGGSAGGQLALLAAFLAAEADRVPVGSERPLPVDGVISWYGPPDLRAQYERFVELPGLTGRSRFERWFMERLEARFGFDVIPVHSLLPSLLGGTPDDVPERYAWGSPMEHVKPGCPPTLLLQGEHDFSGAAPEVRRLHEALLGAGCRSVLFELPESEHGFDLYRPHWSPAAQAAAYVVDRFLASLF